MLLVWRARSADQPIRISVPAFWQPAGRLPHGGRAGVRDARRHASCGRRHPRAAPRICRCPRCSTSTSSREYLRVFAARRSSSLLGIFYISTFIDLADKLFAATRPRAMLLRYFYFQTPQYVYYVIPMAVLVATLVTIGVMTKNSELIVMRACGVSLYRTALPLVLFGALASAALFLLQEQVLASANREADRLEPAHPRLPAATSPAQPALDRRARRRHLPLRFLRLRGQPVHAPVGLPTSTERAGGCSR